MFSFECNINLKIQINWDSEQILVNNKYDHPRKGTLLDDSSKMFEKVSHLTF